MRKINDLSKILLSIGVIAGCANTTPESGKPISGINLNNLDPKVRAQDDFYQYVNGTWLANTQIPNDKARWGIFEELREQSINNTHKIITKLTKQNNPKSSEQQKIADLYISFMDEDKINQLGTQPIKPILAQIDAIENKHQLAKLLGDPDTAIGNTPFDISIYADKKNSSLQTVYLSQSGLGLPNRDYYLKLNDKNMKRALDGYRLHISNMLKLLGEKHTAKTAQNIVDLETKLAKIQWDVVQNRDPIKTYNKYATTSKSTNSTIPLLSSIAPDFDWQAFLDAAKLSDKISVLIVQQPSYLKEFDQIFKETSLSTWKDYLRWHTLSAHAGLLSTPFVEENFAFKGKLLSGTKEISPRWKRGVYTVEGVIGEGLGKIYVKEYFPPENKAEMKKLVANLMKAYSNSIKSLDWMSEPTKQKALEKLNAMNLKIGYPDKWRDYSKLEIKADDLVGNMIRSNIFNYNYALNKLGKPTDKTTWGMTPQTVNAYYSQLYNEIVFPAAILQPPFFNVKADIAVNYGAIGAVIGHEISHGFDDKGSQYDAKGNLNEWFTPEDRQKFKEKTTKLVAQYSKYEPVKHYHVNGELCLGENIADNSGLEISYKAYLLALNGKGSKIIDNFTGPQRFYMGFAGVWATKYRTEALIQQLKNGPHSPGNVRAKATVRNQPEFYKAFRVQPEDKMYLRPKERVSIW